LRPEEGASLTIPLPEAGATGELAKRLAAALPADTAGWMILLQGELGAGKSTLARALLHALGFDGTVPSPTYTLVEPYEIDGRTVYHIDLYRIAGEGELPYLGWADLRQGLMLIEWPERVAALRRQADLLITLDFEDAGRRATVTALTLRAAAVLAGTAPLVR
jgi:tRNA threonylcarbamoyladenosine biosynthesis protein TsaE